MNGLVVAGFSFNRFADRDARSTTRSKSEAELVDLLRRNIDNPWQPPGGGAVGALSHDVIHGLDVTEALGLPARRRPHRAGARVGRGHGSSSTSGSTLRDGG